MKRLSPLFRTPRAVKRFVNTYRLVRVGIPSIELAAFEGTAASPGRYRIAQVLLGVVAGYPNLAPRFLQLLRQQSSTSKGSKQTWQKFLAHCDALGKAQEQTSKPRSTNTAKKNTTAKKAPSDAPPKAGQFDTRYYWQEWMLLCGTLRDISADDYLPAHLEDYHDLIPRVARFSFSVSMLSE